MEKQPNILDQTHDLEDKLRLVAARGEIYEGRVQGTILYGGMLIFFIFIGFNGLITFSDKIESFWNLVQSTYNEGSFFSREFWFAYALENLVGTVLGILLLLIMAYFILALWISKKYVSISSYELVQYYRPLPIPPNAKTHLYVSYITEFEITSLYNKEEELMDYYVQICGRENNRYQIMDLFLSETSKDIEALKQKLEKMLGRKATLKK